MAIRTFLSCVTILVTLAGDVSAQALTDAERAAIDAAAKAAVDATGSRGASFSVFRGGKIVYEQAYGIGRIDPQTPARSDMRYGIGSDRKSTRLNSSHVALSR